MTDSSAAATALARKLRETVLARPEMVLDDSDMMRALAAASDRAMGDNVVDMRALAMDRLDARLQRLEDTHSTVLAAAYENLAGMNQVHRATLQMLEAPDFSRFLADLDGEVAAILRVDCLRLVLESHDGGDAPLAGVGAVVHVAAPGYVAGYIAGGRGGHRPVVLRGVPKGIARPYGAAQIRSEALMRIDLGPGRLPGLLALGSTDPGQFTPAQATDLLAFFAGVFERALRRWLG